MFGHTPLYTFRSSLMIFGAIFLHEVMSVREMAGAAIIFAATILGQRE